MTKWDSDIQVIYPTTIILTQQGIAAIKMKID